MSNTQPGSMCFIGILEALNSLITFNHMGNVRNFYREVDDIDVKINQKPSKSHSEGFALILSKKKGF